MALSFHPEAGTILICDYDTGFVPPEMVKRRPVVVISPRFKHRTGLCSVVPLSTTNPVPPMPWHHRLAIEPPLPRPFDSATAWAKCDHVATVSFARLHLIRMGRGADGRREYRIGQVSGDDLAAIRRCVAEALGIAVG